MNDNQILISSSSDEASIYCLQQSIPSDINGLQNALWEIPLKAEATVAAGNGQLLVARAVTPAEAARIIQIIEKTDTCPMTRMRPLPLPGKRIYTTSPAII